MPISEDEFDHKPQHHGMSKAEQRRVRLCCCSFGLSALFRHVKKTSSRLASQLFPCAHGQAFMVFFFVTEAFALCINKFVLCVIYSQYTTIHQYSDIIYTIRSHYGYMFRP